MNSRPRRAIGRMLARLMVVAMTKVTTIVVTIVMTIAIATMTLSAAATGELGASGAWKSATPSRAIALPADHVSHPDYKIEWWYYTGNLDAENGQRFGFQLTFFRVGVDPRPENPSRWAVRDLHMAHFALTDVTRGTFHFSDRLQRDAAGWAGAATDRYAVWNGTWSAREESATPVATGAGTEAAPGKSNAHRIQAADKDFAIDLVLRNTDRWVAHGRDGYSQKGRDPGNASHYYSLTRLKTSGTVTIGEQRYAVSGSSWMDHEFGTSMLEPEQVGWDWFALQLEDGRDLMLWQMRRRDGTIDPFSSGTLVGKDGSRTHLAKDDCTLTVVETWTSPDTRATYPTRWRVTIPRERLTLDVRAPVRASELHTPRSTGVTYWEGAVDITGESGAGAASPRAAGASPNATTPIRGRGYMELTGYAGAPISDSFR